MPAQRQGMPQEERRLSPRYRLRDAYTTIRWSEGPDQKASQGNVLNVSGGGAALLVENAPAARSHLELQIGRGLPFGPIEACVLANSNENSGKVFLRLQFMHWVSIDPLLEKHLDERLWERFPVRVTKATLSWFEAGSKKTVMGKLLNISAGGAAIIVDFPIPGGERIFFELESDAGKLESAESTLVVNSIDPSGLRIARIKFVDACPMGLFELAINGGS
jgi:c-di-GMP-binding flagellar brake protein YcgR